jgi:hypothetical protein
MTERALSRDGEHGADAPGATPGALLTHILCRVLAPWKGHAEGAVLTLTETEAEPLVLRRLVTIVGRAPAPAVQAAPPATSTPAARVKRQRRRSPETR